jgi:serine/threonine-protein kinase
MSHRFGKYEILSRLGTGGMGVVYLARDTVLGRQVALKVLDERYQGEEGAVRRFLHEARVAASLTHPNIVVIYDFGTEQGTSFIAMEYLDGENLRSVIARRAPMSLARKLIIALQVAKALDHANRRGVVHRDVKPSNIQLLPGGEVKLMDFGIAKLASADMTASGVTVGTPHYASPEQVRSLPVTAASDVFSYGLVLYELLTYRRAFTGEDFAALVYRIVFADPAPYEPQDEIIPAAVRELVRRCLAKQPEARYQGCGPVIHVLRAVLLDFSQRRSRNREPLPSEEIWDEAEENTVKALLAVAEAPHEDAAPMAPVEPLAKPDDSNDTALALPASAAPTPRPMDLDATPRPEDRASPAIKPAPAGPAVPPPAEPAAVEDSPEPPTAPLGFTPVDPAESGAPSEEADEEGADDVEPRPVRAVLVALAVGGSALAAIVLLGVAILGGSRGAGPQETPRAPPQQQVRAGADPRGMGKPAELPIAGAEPSAPAVAPSPVQETEPAPPVVFLPTPVPTRTPTATPTPEPTWTWTAHAVQAVPSPVAPTETPTPLPAAEPSPELVEPAPALSPTPQARSEPAPSEPVPTESARQVDVSTPPAVDAEDEPAASQADRQAIRELLRGYILALQRRDAASVRGLWPDIDPRRLEQLQADFAQIESQRVEIRVRRFAFVEGAAPGERRVQIHGLLRRTVQPSTGPVRVEESEVLIELRRAGQEWRISEVR